MTSLSNNSQDTTSQLAEQILATLQDIAQKIEIRPDFSIVHPDYQPPETPQETSDRLPKMPENLQQKYLSLQLRSFLYGIYYNGWLKTIFASEQANKNLPKDLENNTYLGVDLSFYEKLHQSNQGQGYFDPNWLVLKAKSEDILVVTKGELKLHIDKKRHLPVQQQEADVGQTVAIRLPKNLVQNGFYMALSNMGAQNHRAESSETVRIYWHLTPQGAVKVMKGLTEQLNPLNIPFSFKVLYNPADYQRYDSGVLYFNKTNYQQIQSIVEQVYQENQDHFCPEIPLFTLPLASGLGLAEEPRHKFATEESFGMNRCQIIANGLLEAWYQGDSSVDGRLEKIFQQFSLLGIDWQRPYLNAEAEDIYQVVGT